MSTPVQEITATVSQQGQLMTTDSLNSCFMPITRFSLDLKVWILLIQVSQLGSKNKAFSQDHKTETNQMNRSWLAASDPHSSGVILSCLLLTKHSMLKMSITSLSIRNITSPYHNGHSVFSSQNHLKIQRVLCLEGVILIRAWWLKNTSFQESVWNQFSAGGPRNHSALLELRAHLATNDERFWPQRTPHPQEETGLCGSYSQHLQVHLTLRQWQLCGYYSYVEDPGRKNNPNTTTNMDVHSLEPINPLSAECWNR